MIIKREFQCIDTKVLYKYWETLNLTKIMSISYYTLNKHDLKQNIEILIRQNSFEECIANKCKFLIKNIKTNAKPLRYNVEGLLQID